MWGEAPVLALRTFFSVALTNSWFTSIKLSAMMFDPDAGIPPI